MVGLNDEILVLNKLAASANSPTPKLTASRRLRSTPYTPRIEALGVSDYSITNHTILPKGFGLSVAEEYWHLKQFVQLWDVSCQRQVELRGPDAAKLAQYMTPRNLQSASIGQCLYAPMIDQHGGMLNDPIILKLADDHFWFSIADSDVLLWAKGLSVGMNLDVVVEEPDVCPLAVQGPRSDDLMAKVFGEDVRSIRFFRFRKLDFNDHSLVVARSGFSKQGGFEIYLDDSRLGVALWDALWEAGQTLNVKPGCPNLIERIEGGLLSYGNEMTRENNPYECGLGHYCDLDSTTDFIGKQTLRRIVNKAPDRIIRGILFEGEACPPCRSTWPLMAGDFKAGYITSAIWSPRFEQNVALGMLDKEFWNPGQAVTIVIEDSAKQAERTGRVVSLPFTD